MGAPTRQKGRSVSSVLPSRVGRGWAVRSSSSSPSSPSWRSSPAAGGVRRLRLGRRSYDRRRRRRRRSTRAISARGSAIIPSPTGQNISSDSSAATPPSAALTPPPPGGIPATVPVPTVRTGIVLQAQSSGQTFTTADKKATLRYPNEWDAQTRRVPRNSRRRAHRRPTQMCRVSLSMACRLR